MTETDFVLWRKKHDQIEKQIAQERAHLVEMESKLHQDEVDALQQACASGLFKIRLGDVVDEYKKLKGIKDVVIVEDIACYSYSGKEKIEFKKDIGIRSQICLGIDIFADGKPGVYLDGFKLSPYDWMANGMFVIDALKDCGSGKMLMFQSEELLNEIVLEFDPNSSALKTNPDIREAVFSVVEQKATKVAEHKK